MENDINKSTIEVKPPEPLVKEFSPKEESKKTPMKKIVLILIVIIAGIGTGYLLNQKNGGLLTGGGTPKTIQTDKIVGSTDTKTFRDNATGVIEKGGIDGEEGTHKLIRTGGESQTVYLTSSVVDLDQFIGKQVKVWGETFAGQKAAWLMDVGKVEKLQ
jgi:hypothetical protein